MKRDRSEIPSLLVNLISGTLQEHERKILENWMSGSPERRRLIKELEDEKLLQEDWELFNSVDVHAAREAMRSKLRTHSSPVRLISSVQVAVVAIILVLGFGFIFYTRSSKMTKNPAIATSSPARSAAKTPPPAASPPSTSPHTTTPYPDGRPSPGKYLTLDHAGRHLILRAHGRDSLLNEGALRFSLRGTTIFVRHRLGEHIDTGLYKLRSFPDSKLNVILSDGSSAQLGPNTEIGIRAGYGVDDRTVQLVGQAFFDVKKIRRKNLSDQDDMLAFKVQMPRPDRMDWPYAPDSKVTIITTGTSFEAMAGPQDSSIQTLLYTGNITVELPNGKKHPVTPGNAYVLDRMGNSSLVKVKEIKGATKWREDEFFFPYQKAGDILQQLGQSYKVKIRYLSVPSGRYLVTGPHDQPITFLLEQMKAAGHFNYTIKADTVFVSR